MCEAGRGLHGLLAVFSFAASRRRPKRHSTQKPDREPRKLAPLLPAPSVLCITAVIFHITDTIVALGRRSETTAVLGSQSAATTPR